MADVSSKTPKWSEIIAKVTTPLGFFTLTCLVIYSILVVIATRATGADRTIIVVGLIAGLIVIVAMVFILAVSPQLQGALTGAQYTSAARTLSNMDLTANDVRFMLVARSKHGRLDTKEFPPDVLLGDSIMPIGERAAKLIKLGLFKKTQNIDYILLTEDGKLLADIFGRLVKSVIDVPKNKRFPFA